LPFKCNLQRYIVAGKPADGNALVGGGSLVAPSAAPTALVVAWPSAASGGSNATLPSYRLRAKFYDSGAAESVHYIAAAAAPVCAGDASASYSAVGVGTYSPASQGRYCATAPWTCGVFSAAASGTNASAAAAAAAAAGVASSAPRAAGWHQLEVSSSPSHGYRVLVDGVVIASGAPKGPLPGVVIAAGLGGAPGIAPGTTATWDEVTASAVDPTVGRVVCVELCMTPIGQPCACEPMAWARFRLGPIAVRVCLGE
jgi:hypothetical protein